VEDVVSRTREAEVENGLDHPVRRNGDLGCSDTSHAVEELDERMSPDVATDFSDRDRHVEGVFSDDVGRNVDPTYGQIRPAKDRRSCLDVVLRPILDVGAYLEELTALAPG
jgi:hypothetical protein